MKYQAIRNRVVNTLMLLCIGSLPALAQTYLFNRAEFASGRGPTGVAFADFNNDGRPDLAVANKTDNTVSIILGQTNGTLGTHLDLASGTGPAAIITGDFNNDGKLDLAVANSGSNTVSLLLGNGDGTFQTHVDFASGTVPLAVAAADFNRDC